MFYKYTVMHIGHYQLKFKIWSMLPFLWLVLTRIFINTLALLGDARRIFLVGADEQYINAVVADVSSYYKTSY